MKCFLNEHDYDQFVQGLEAQIAGPHKCAVLGIFDADPPFGYSIGLTDQGWPELIIAGIDGRTACSIINGLVARFAAVGVPEPRVSIYRIVENYPVRLQPISDMQLEEYLHQAVARQERVNGPPPRAVQIVYPDPDGHWPDDPACEPKTVHAQMLLTEKHMEQVQ